MTKWNIISPLLIVIFLNSCSSTEEKAIEASHVQTFEHRTKPKLTNAIERHGEVNRAQTRSYFERIEAERLQHENILEYEETLPFVGIRSIKVERDLPNIFLERATLTELKPLSLDMLANKLGGIGGMIVHFADDVSNPYRNTSQEEETVDATGQTFNIDGNEGVAVNGSGADMEVTVRSYSGSFKGLLDRIASQLNISWHYDHKENVVVFNRFISKSYRIFTSPSVNSMITAAGDSESGGMAALNLSETVWASVESGVESMLSAGGRVKANESAGLITVTDTLFVHESVSKLIEEINKGNQRMITVEVEFLTIRSNEEINRGTAFDVLFNDGKFTGNIISGFSNILSGGGLTSGIIKETGELGKFKDSQSIITSLNSLGHVHVTDKQFIRAINNQVTPLKDVEYIPYVSNQSVTITDGISSTTTEQDEVVVGFSMNILPSVMDDGETMLLQVGILQSDLINLETVQTENSLVQQPRRSERSFIEKVNVRSGETIVMMGMEKRRTEYQDDNTFGKFLKFLGFSSSAKDLYETSVVLVTPTVSNYQTNYQYE